MENLVPESSGESFEWHGRQWVKLKVNYSPSGESFIVSVPEEFLEHVNPEGLAFGGSVFGAIKDCVSSGDGVETSLSEHGNLADAQGLLSSWFGFTPLAKRSVRENVVEALYLDDKPRRIGLFFSAGVDSTFTLTWLQGRAHGGIVALSLIHTRDGAPDSTQLELYEGIRRKLAADGVEMIYVATNVMTCNDRIADLWAFATHGACIAAIGHLMSGKVDKYFLSSSDDYSALIPWGSHPLLDPLFSSNELTISHFGAEFTRYDKIAGIARSGKGMATLSVCGKGPQPGEYCNCSKCPKCLRSMTALDLCGARGAATSFDWSDYSPGSFAEVCLRGANEFPFAKELLRAAEDNGRADVADALRTAIKKSRFHGALYAVEKSVRLRLIHAHRQKKWLKPLKDAVYRVISPSRG